MERHFILQPKMEPVDNDLVTSVIMNTFGMARLDVLNKVKNGCGILWEAWDAAGAQAAVSALKGAGIDCFSAPQSQFIDYPRAKPLRNFIVGPDGLAVDEHMREQYHLFPWEKIYLISLGNVGDEMRVKEEARQVALAKSAHGISSARKAARGGLPGGLNVLAFGIVGGLVATYFGRKLHEWVEGGKTPSWTKSSGNFGYLYIDIFTTDPQTHYRISRGNVNFNYLGPRKTIFAKENFWLMLCDLFRHGHNSYFSFGRQPLENPLEHIEEIIYPNLDQFDNHNRWLINILVRGTPSV